MPNQRSRIGLVFLVGLLTLPFLAFVHPAPFPSFYNEWLVAVGILGLCAVLMGFEGALLEIPAPACFVAAFSGLLALQLVLGRVHYPGQVGLAALYLLSVALLMVSTRSLVRSFGHDTLVRLVAWAILVAGLFSGVIGVLQYWGIHSWLDGVITQQVNARAYANLVQPNHFCGLEALASIALVYLAAERRMHWSVAFPAGVMLALGMVLSGSRTAWLYLAVMPLLSIVVHRMLGTGSSRRLIYGSLLLVALFILAQQILGGFASAATSSSQAAARLTTIEGSSLAVRLGFLREAWQAFLGAPLLGVGYQQFAWQHFVQQAATPNPIFFAYEDINVPDAHNLFFHVLAEFGVLGGALLLGLAVWLIAKFRSQTTSATWLIYAMLSILLIHSMLEYPLRYLYFLAPFAILLVLASDTSVATLSSTLMRIVSPVIMLLGAAILWATYSSYEHLAKAYGGTSESIVLDDVARDHLMKASAGGIFDPQIDHLLNVLPAGFGGSEERRLQLRISERSMRQSPTASRVYRHVFLLAINDNLDEARQYLTMATRAYPGSFKDFQAQIRGLREERPEDGLLRALGEIVEDHRPMAVVPDR